MKTKQHTIKEPVSVSGVGLHTGKASRMTFVPADENHGIKFRRVDLDGQPVVEADVDNVSDTSRGTTISKGEAVVHTVEHTLAALVGLEIDNVMIEVDGPEPPAMDGSSIEFVNILKQAGLQEQDAIRNFYELTEGVVYSDPANNIEIAALPLNDYRVTVMVDYNSTVLGSQHASLNAVSQFEKEFAACRTFCFFHELEMLHSQNLIQGGDLNNAIVVVEKPVTEKQISDVSSLFNQKDVKVEQGILNNVELRFKNEPARHKLLDLMGDLALVGRPIKAQILAARPGHAANVEMARKIKRAMQKQKRKNVPAYDPTAESVLDVNQISQVLPHRYPFQLVDKITYIDKGCVIGIKNVTMNEPFFQGHFPGNPVMPGVLQVEAMAQTGGIFMLNSVDDPENYWTYFVGIDNCRFKRMVGPGDTLIMRCELLAPIRRGIAKMRGQAFVGDRLVCEATMSASLVKKD